MSTLSERLNKEAAFGTPNASQKYQKILKEYNDELTKQLSDYAFYVLIPHIETINPRGETDSWCPELKNIDSYDKHYGVIDLALWQIKEEKTWMHTNVCEMLSYSLGAPFVFAGQQKDKEFVCMYMGLYKTEALGTLINAICAIKKPQKLGIESLNALMETLKND
jgi:hypothetical protein